MGILALGSTAIALGLYKLTLALTPLLARVGVEIPLPVPPDSEEVADMAFRGFGLIVGLGLVAFWLRFKHRLVYAIGEIVVGAVVGLLAFNQYQLYHLPAELQVETGPLFALLGGVDIVVRGLDNLDKSLINDTWARWASDEFLLLKNDPDRNKPL